ncbi:MAG: phosphotransferase [Geodermatophilaceae bacterium]|nr:phosphotransferase [Geodermatophilaceae bacterium]
MSVFASAAGLPIMDRDALVAQIRTDFGVSLRSMSQISGGQDSDAVLIRAETVGGAMLAVKVSRHVQVGPLQVCAFLAESVGSGIPAPLPARSGLPYSVLNGRRLSLTPWISGRRAFEAGMDAHQWKAFGALLSQVHATAPAPPITDRLPTESYQTREAAIVRVLDQRIRGLQAGRPGGSDDPLTGALVCKWNAASDCLAVILAQIDGLGDELRAGAAAQVVCHGDAHIANVLLDDGGALWLLDWDEVVRAPRERDLMFVIGGVLADAPVTAQQQAWFFDGYGAVEIDPLHLAYYRCSWALQDVADYAARILDPPAGPSAAGSQALALFGDAVSPTGIASLALTSLQEIGRWAT